MVVPLRAVEKFLGCSRKKGNYLRGIHAASVSGTDLSKLHHLWHLGNTAILTYPLTAKSPSRLPMANIYRRCLLSVGTKSPRDGTKLLTFHFGLLCPRFAAAVVAAAFLSVSLLGRRLKSYSPQFVILACPKHPDELIPLCWVNSPFTDLPSQSAILRPPSYPCQVCFDHWSPHRSHRFSNFLEQFSRF